MHVTTFLHKVLGSVTHKSRLNMLAPILTALIKMKAMTLTKLGRALELPIQERSGIRKIDRFLSNIYFQTRSIDIYTKITQWVIGKNLRPQIIVDWTKLPNSENYALRASLIAVGRAITLYEEVHPKKKEGNSKVHNRFLDRLNSMLSQDCQPIIITDAGFKNPWFRKVLKLEWDFIGRVRGETKYKTQDGWAFCHALHKKATRIPQYLGEKILSKSSGLSMAFYIVKNKIKGRKKLTKAKKVCKDKDSKNHSRSYREPWLLVSSIKGKAAAKIIVALYARRMTIEEGFRDLKSSKYGFNMEENKTLRPGRLTVWLLLAALACLFAWIIGRTAEALNLHYQFQANSIRHRRVLSFFYLGCQIIRKNIKIPIDLSNISYVDTEICI